MADVTTPADDFVLEIQGVGTVALPSTLGLTVEALAPTPSRIAAIDASLRAQVRFYTAEEGARITSAWLTGKVSEVASRPGLAGDRDAAQDHARAAAWSRRPAILSPATVLARALEGAAGTDAERHSAFRAAGTAYRRDRRAFFAPHILAHALDPAPVCQGLPRSARLCRLRRRSGPRALRPARSGQAPGGGGSRVPGCGNPASCRPGLPSSFRMAWLMRPNRNDVSWEASPVATQPRDVSATSVRRGDAGRGASSARVRRYVLDLMPLIDAMRGEVARTPQCFALELTRRGICKPRGGAVWTPVDVGRLLHRIGTERAR